jgi:hypothetical protein
MLYKLFDTHTTGPAEMNHIPCWVEQREINSIAKQIGSELIETTKRCQRRFMERITLVR